jgi:acyl carrier protein
MDTLELLREFVKRRVANPPEEITLESRLEDIGVDSLTLLDLMFDMEDKFGVRMPDDLPRPETVAQLIEIFEKLKPAKNA